ncbi:WHG domain-containing protein [Plantibacter flavus]|uniref:TetR/AcrR family transcriptional regulator n=1 Tax=Plantibacter flavus TaxID=150123 RepID=UPI003F13A4C1
MTDALALRPKFSRQRVIVGAAAFADAHGPEALTLAALARELGTSAPALLKHVRSTDDLRTAVATLAHAQLSSELDVATAGLHGSDALTAAATSYRRFALAHPGRYALAFSVTDARTDAGVPADRELVLLLERVLGGRGLDSVAMTDAGRILRAALHGFVSLEITGGFARGVEPLATYTALVDLLDHSPTLGTRHDRQTT